MFRRVVSACLVSSVSACATPAQLVIDPSSISDQATYLADTAECTSLAESYDGNAAASAGSALVGSGLAGVGATMVVGLATGGLLIAPMAALAAVTAGGMAGAGRESNKVNRARENILAQCMEARGYRAYNPNAG